MKVINMQQKAAQLWEEFVQSVIRFGAIQISRRNKCIVILTVLLVCMLVFIFADRPKAALLSIYMVLFGLIGALFAEGNARFNATKQKAEFYINTSPRQLGINAGVGRIGGIFLVIVGLLDLVFGLSY